MRKNGGTYVYEVYVVERAKACFDGTARQNTSKCGTETSGTYIKDYCATDAGNTNITHCPKKYAGANPVNTGDTANVATLTAKALNAEGTALLPTFIADGAANTATDDPANFGLKCCYTVEYPCIVDIIKRPNEHAANPCLQPNDFPQSSTVVSNLDVSTCSPLDLNCGSIHSDALLLAHLPTLNASHHSLQARKAQANLNVVLDVHGSSVVVT